MGCVKGAELGLSRGSEELEEIFLSIGSPIREGGLDVTRFRRTA